MQGFAEGQHARVSPGLEEKGEGTGGLSNTGAKQSRLWMQPTLQGCACRKSCRLSEEGCAAGELGCWLAYIHNTCVRDS